MDPDRLVYDAAEHAAERAVRSTFAPLIDSMSLLTTRATGGQAPRCTHALPDEIRGIADTARALIDYGEAATQVAVRLCDGQGEVVGAVDFTWRLTRDRLRPAGRTDGVAAGSPPPRRGRPPCRP